MLSMFSVFPRRKGLLEHMAAATVHMTGQTGKNTHTHTHFPLAQEVQYRTIWGREQPPGLEQAWQWQTG